MIEKNFKDRIPTYPGRVEMLPVEGQMNVFTMKRADQPTEEGTPLDKAAFNSIIHSRLTGRYYEPTLNRENSTGRTNLTSNLFSSSSWTVDDEDNNISTDGVIKVVSSSNNGSSWYSYKVFSSSGWQSMGGTVSWIQIYQPTLIKVKNITFRVEFQYPARFVKLQIQGSNNGENWTVCGELTSINTGTIAYELGAPGEYSYYRIYVESSDSNRVTISNLSYSLYDIITYNNNFVVGSEFPADWTKGQRAMISTPANINTLAVTSNSLNGIKINTILLSSKRYELIYNGSAFIAKEV